MATSSQYVLKSDQKKKERLIDCCGGKCAICGYDKCSSALEFHHTNPLEKDFAISNLPHCSFEKALAEIQKCIMVCANCHREIHAGLIDNIPEPYIDANKVEMHLQDLQELKTRKKYYCKNCGVEITRGAEYCSFCYQESKQNPRKPSREILKQEIRNIPFTHLGQKYDVTDNAVKKWCISYGLPHKKSDINKYSDEEWAQL